MDYYELLEFLDLDDATQFEYFEAMADIIECEDYIEQEALFQLFDGADNTMIEELIQDYFEDILDGLPDNSGEIFSLLHQIKLCLLGIISQAEDDSDMRKFTDEFYRFISWYSHESEVELVSEDDSIPIYCNIRDAITASRMEKLGGEKYRYDFENSLDYQLDSYTMSFTELMEAEDNNEGTIIFSPEELEYDEQ